MAHVTVLYFAALREQRGCSSERVPLPAGTTARELYQALFPPGAGGQIPVSYARNQQLIEADTVLQDGDELALLPPLGGG